jgi:asparagine synthase (glutamine-hydrolysing)
MCGICGEYGRPNNRRVKMMSDCLRHRGPDDVGFYEGPLVCLGIRRLSIIDLHTGHQPITNEDGSVIVVFNGEIYNHEELRRDLERKGHRFQSRSDTEVLVHLYEEDGDDFVDYLRGMFAIALWDNSLNRLVLARDRLGVKPLYVVRNGAVIAFSSELRALVGAGHAPLELDPLAVTRFVGFPCIPAPRTAFPGVRAVRPAEMLVINEEGIRSRLYWDIAFPHADAERDPGPIDDYARNLRERLTEAVNIRQMSDVPLGAFLSGGLDSSSLVALMASRQERPVRTFSLGFSGNDHPSSIPGELGFARMVARYFRTDHTEIIFDGGDVRRRLCRMLWAMDQPSGDALQHYLLSEVAKTGVTVAISGTGADELFAGYDFFGELVRLDRLSKAVGFVPRPWKVRMGEWLAGLPASLVSRGPIRKLSTFIRGEAGLLSRYRLNRRFYRQEELASLLKPMLWEALVSAAQEADELSELEEAIQGRSIISAASHLQLKTDMVNLLLRDQDAVSMAHSLEVRVPFLDHHVVEYATKIPWSLKLRGSEVKYVLKKAVADLLPYPVIQRSKKGFIFPMDLWMRGQLTDIVRQSLSRESIEKRGFFNWGPVHRLVSDFFAGKEPFFKVWNLVVLELWCRLALDHKQVLDPGERPLEDLL